MRSPSSAATAGSPALSFDEELHRAWEGSVELPRVTTILRAVGLVGRMGLDDPAALARGRAVHQAIARALVVGAPVAAAAARLLKEASRLGEPVGAGGMVEAAARWADRQPPSLTVVASEYGVGSAALGYAGIVDAVLRRADGRHLVLEVKTGHLPPWAGIQTAAYARAYEAAVPEAAPMARAVLVLRPDGPGWSYAEYAEETRRSHEALFLAALLLVTWRRRTYGRLEGAGADRGHRRQGPGARR